MSTSLVTVVLVAAVFARLPPSSGFEWIKDPGSVVNMTYPDQKSLTLRWEWKLSKNDRFLNARIIRYKTIDKNNTTANTASCHKFGNTSSTISWPYYNSSCQVGEPGEASNMQLNIDDVTKQSFNLVPSPSNVDVLKFNYTYECIVKLFDASNHSPKATKLVVYIRPTITKIPENKYVDSVYKDVTLNCIAEGNPKPTITWEHKHPSGVVRYFKGEELIISKSYRDPFQLSDIGIYTCIATNNVGTASATAALHYTECGSGCFTDDKISIEMTNVTYTYYSNRYPSAKYKNLKDAIEKDCFYQYFKARMNIFSCIVTGFRQGSVIADIKITYPNYPRRKPLQTAIETGKFAGQRVRTSLIPDKSDSSSSSNKSGSSSSSSAAVTVIVLGVLLALSLVVNLILISYIIWKKYRESKETKARSSNTNQGALYMNNEAFQDQEPSIAAQNTEFVISQEDHEPIPIEYQSMGNNIAHHDRAPTRAVQNEMSLISNEQYEVIPPENRSTLTYIAPQDQEATSGIHMQSVINEDQHEQTPPLYHLVQMDTAYQDQDLGSNGAQNRESVISQEQNQPIPPVHQSTQNHTATYSSLCPKTKLPPTPAFLTNSGPYEDLQANSHLYQSLNDSKEI